MFCHVCVTTHPVIAHILLHDSVCVLMICKVSRTPLSCTGVYDLSDFNYNTTDEVAKNITAMINQAALYSDFVGVSVSSQRKITTLLRWSLLTRGAWGYSSCVDVCECAHHRILTKAPGVTVVFWYLCMSCVCHKTGRILTWPSNHFNTGTLDMTGFEKR